MLLVRHRIGYLSLLTTGFVVPLVILIRRLYFGLDWFFPSVVLLQSIQTISAFFALAGGVVLYIVGVCDQAEDDGASRRRYIPWITCMLLSSGVITALSSSLADVDSRYMLMESLAQIFGVACALGVLLPRSVSQSNKVRWSLPVIVFFLAAGVGLRVLISPAGYPGFLIGDLYGPHYVLTNQITGCLYLLVSIRFIALFKKYQRSSDLVFAHLTLLSGASDVIFQKLHLWGPIWWTWHSIQFVAFALTFLYLFTLYYRQEKALQANERKLRRTAADLERSNKELENFANLASHDLREPLRMVSSYLSLLEKRHAPALNQEAIEYLHFSVDGAKRMQVLIDGLLKYAKARHEPILMGDVNCKKVVSDAIEDLKFAIADVGGNIHLEELPTVMGDETQLRRVFENLIQNALKYLGDAPPEILISAKDENDFWKFEVADNGIGVPPQYRHKIFDLFARGPSGRQDGTGMGLAACKAIVERHGGYMGVDSKDTGGSIFFFTLPKQGVASTFIYQN